MKNIILSLNLLLLISSCKNENINNSAFPSKVATAKYVSFGDSITADGALTKEQMIAKYNTMNAGDTIEVKFKSTVKEVCQKKGCWMNLELGENKESFVRFKHYGFFMPKNAAGSQAIVQGKAFVSIETIDELKHYAKDAGKSKAAIDSIKSSKTNYSFTANGVLIQQ